MKPIRLSVKVLKKIEKYSKKNDMQITMDKICANLDLTDVQHNLYGTKHQKLRIMHLWRGVLFVFYAKDKLTKKQKKYVIKYLEIGSKKIRNNKNLQGRAHSKAVRKKISRTLKITRYNK